MPINLIACVAIHKSKLAIGRGNELLFKLPQDMAHFKHITSAHIDVQNIVLMGNTTYKSIPEKYRPLQNRINFVLTNDAQLHTALHCNSIGPHYCNMLSFTEFYKKQRHLNVFVIGGAKVYNYFLSTYCNKLFKPEKLYITHVQATVIEPDTFMDNFYDDYKLEWHSQICKDNDVVFRMLIYTRSHMRSQEYKYFDVINNILTQGNTRSDRTETGTISIFGTKIEFDISDGIPLMTTRRISFKTIVEELLWFCRGDTDAKLLQEKNINIWNANTSRTFLDNRNLQHYPEGVLGPGYGWAWRFYGAPYDIKYADTRNIIQHPGGFDQLAHVVHLLQTDPFSRRIVLSSWNPNDLDKIALLPCHTHLQFYVQEINGVKYLSCMFNMRSSDLLLAATFNIVSYSVLTYILAAKCNMRPHKIIYVAGDTHIYQNQLEQAREQSCRLCRPEPKLQLNTSIVNKDWKDITYEDFELIGYFPDAPIIIPMAI